MPDVDYDALAQAHGASVDYDAIAAQVNRPTPPPAWATEGMGAPSTTAVPNPDLIPIEQRTLQQAADAAPDMLKAWATTVAPAVVLPGVLGMATKFGGPAVRGTISAATSPLGAGAIGAALGGYKGGVEGALYGGATGYATGVGGGQVGALLKRLGLNKPASTDMVKGMSRASSPVAGERNIDDMMAAAIAKQRKANPSGVFGDDVGVPQLPAQKPVTQRDALLEQVAMRDPDWRLVDAVPIKANQTKGIIEAGESRVGLAERAAQAAKTGDAEEVDRLLKALRQRMHISATSSAPRRR